MRDWTHSICELCWTARDPEREPVRIVEKYRNIRDCCFCGIANRSGIFARESPDSPRLHCKGDHPE